MKVFVVALAAIAANFVKGNNIPSMEMVEAKTLGEFERALGEYEKPSESHLRRRLQSGNFEFPYKATPKVASDYGGAPGFYHGVASGSPLASSVIIWTRYTPATVNDVIALEYRIAEYDETMPLNDHLDPSKNRNVKFGRVNVDGAKDFTLKIDVTGLKSYTKYVYAFTDGYVVSQVGMTKTAPAEDKHVKSLTYAVYTCSNFPNGYFHAYDVGSIVSDLDFWVHTGDYIYEYGNYSTYARDSPERGELLDPKWEIVDCQDYRNRYAQYRRDEALQTIHRVAPLIANWDDHEHTNNVYGLGLESNTGAENHQPICSAPLNATAAQKSSAKCDRAEGTSTRRFTCSAQAYMEWIPIRQDFTDVLAGVGGISNRYVVEWGKLATIVNIDTRLSQRSAWGTLASAFGQFGFAYADSNYTAYSSNPAYKAIADNFNAQMSNASNSIIGDHKYFVEDKFAKSKAAGKPWQVFVGATGLGPSITPDFSRMWEVAPASSQDAVKTIMDNFLKSASAGFFRAAVAMSKLNVAWNPDEYSGHKYERDWMLEMFNKSANNVFFLSGDLHDGWLWTVNKGGASTGEPRAINAVPPGVTSPGWGPLLIGTFNSLLGSTVGGPQVVKDMIHGIWRLTNPGLAYADVYEKGLLVIKHTKKQSVTEYFHITPQDILANYTAARTKSGNMTASFRCGGSFVTDAKKPGSLTPQACGTVAFETKRPAYFNMAVPAKMTCDDNKRAKFTVLGKTKSCNRLSKITAADRKVICANSNAAAACPATCAGYC